MCELVREEKELHSFIRSLMDAYLGWFHILADVSCYQHRNTVTFICCFKLLCVYISRSGISGSYYKINTCGFLVLSLKNKNL